jgi:hypothetical protein
MQHRTAAALATAVALGLFVEACAAETTKVAPDGTRSGTLQVNEVK